MLLVPQLIILLWLIKELQVDHIYLSSNGCNNRYISLYIVIVHWYTDFFGPLILFLTYNLGFI